jgi:hypothetical protein
LSPVCRERIEVACGLTGVDIVRDDRGLAVLIPDELVF